MNDFPRPYLTVDAFVRDLAGRLLLIRRGRPPFQDFWALPGGFVEVGETTEAACARETLEETGLAVDVGALLGVFSRPDRDPRGHTVSVVYRCRPVSGEVRGGDDAAEARWFTSDEVARLDLAFDHAEILRKGLFPASAEGVASPKSI